MRECEDLYLYDQNITASEVEYLLKAIRTYGYFINVMPLYIVKTLAEDRIIYYMFFNSFMVFIHVMCRGNMKVFIKSYIDAVQEILERVLEEEAPRELDYR